MFHSHSVVLGRHFMLCQGLHDAASVWRSEVAQRQKQIQAAPCTMRRQFLVEREHEGFMGSTVPSCRFKKSFVRRAGGFLKLRVTIFGIPILRAYYIGVPLSMETTSSRALAEVAGAARWDPQHEVFRKSNRSRDELMLYIAYCSGGQERDYHLVSHGLLLLALGITQVFRSMPTT